MRTRIIRIAISLTIVSFLLLANAAHAAEPTQSTFQASEIVNQDGAGLDSYSTLPHRAAWLGTGQNTEKSFLGMTLVGNSIPADATVEKAELVFVNNTERNQWIQLNFNAFVELSANPADFTTSLPEARTLSTAFTSNDTNIEWLIGTEFKIDMTAAVKELIATTGVSEKISVVLRGSGDKWSRKFFYKYDENSSNLPKLIVSFTSDGEDPTNNPPVFSSIPAQETNEDTAFSPIDLDNFVSDPGDTLSFSFVPVANLNVSIDAEHNLEISPLADWNGNADLTLVARDSVGQEASSVVKLTVLPVNDVPVFTSTPVFRTNDGELYQYVITATDVDSDVLTFSVTDGPEAMFVEGNVLKWTPGQADVGVHNINVKVSDGELNVVQGYLLEVIDKNYAPVFTSSPLTSVNEDSTYSYQMLATDHDGDTLTFSITKAPGDVSLAGDTIYWQPKQSDVGVHEIILTVDDGIVKTNQEFLLTVVNVNDLPVITSTPVTTAKEAENYSYQLTTSDEDGDVLTYSLASAPTGMIVDSAGLISWTPGYDQAGNHSIKVEVSDGQATVAQEFTILVANTNRAPSAAGLITPLNGEIGTSIFARLDWTDSVDLDADELVYDLYFGTDANNLPKIAGSLVISNYITAQLDYSTQYFWKVGVSDGQAVILAETWNFTTEPKPNLAPVANAGVDQVVNTGATVVLNGASSSDPDGDEIVFNWAQTAGPTVALSSNTIANPTFVAPGVAADTNFEFELKVTDPVGASGTDRVVITVKPILESLPIYPISYKSLDTIPVAISGTKNLSKLFDGDVNTLGVGHNQDRKAVTVIMEYKQPYRLSGFRVHMQGDNIPQSTNYRVFAADNVTDLQTQSGSFRVVKDFTLSGTGSTDLVFSTQHEAKVFGLWANRTILNGFVYLSEITPL